ncbi:MAG: hypothetical protein QGG17_06385, partial [Rhodospirillales bacterium]|nr:hypothetical protein [Rhodospirillales bacterium]
PEEAQVSFHPSGTPLPIPKHLLNTLILIYESASKVSEIGIYLGNPGSNLLQWARAQLMHRGKARPRSNAE